LDSRAQVLWLRYREQRELCDRLPDETTKKGHERAHRELFAIEDALRADISEAVSALACITMIEIADETPEEIPGLHRAALAAIRSQLIGGIAEAADRVLAERTSPAKSVLSVSAPRMAASTSGLILASWRSSRGRAARARATATRF
jgi:hypothetical protein